MFTVRSQRPAYWRLTSLDRFDGTLWSSGGSFEAASGPLPNGPSPERSSRTIEQHFERAFVTLVRKLGFKHIKAQLALGRAITLA